ncbi:MAG TPA: sugar phosphate isomerase/epimerase [Thermoanaerobacterales bacterium]|nr:sugar phosphate isomerase/epimerase [Thermoanaerobacterales bacterium]
MKLSISIAENAGENAPIVLRGNYVECIKKASEIGYKAVEIHVNNPLALNIEEIMNACYLNKISVSTLGTGMGYVIDGLSFTDPDLAIREKAVERILTHINVAKKLNAGVIIGSMRGKIPNVKEHIKYEHYAIECLKKVLENAEKNNVKIFLEAINRYETNFVNNVEDGLDIIEKVNSNYLKLHLDTFHMNIEEPNIEQSIELAGKYLGHLHFADSNRWYPGAGHINFESIIKILKKINYKGFIAFECLPWPTQDEAAVKAFEYVNALYEIY